MASTYFSYIPISGHGDTVVSAYAQATNSGQTSKEAVITFDDGGSPWYLHVSQYYKPYTIMPVKVFPASGGTLNFTVNSKYDYFFHEIPNWTDLRAKRGNIHISCDTKIEGRENVMYTLTASANTGGSPKTTFNTFSLGYYDLNGSAQTAGYINIKQNGSGTTDDVQIPVSLDFHASTNRNFTVTLNFESLVEEPLGHVISFTGGTGAWAGTFNATISLVSAETPLYLTVNVGKERFDAFNYENNIAVDYGTDSLYESGPIATDYVFNTIYQPGQAIDIGIDVQDI